jgi:AraC-like DNA-binding protein
MLTACGMDEQRIEGFESGADAYILKPFNADILKVRIQKLIEKQQNVKRLIDNEWLLGEGRKTLADHHKAFMGKFRKYVETHIQEEIDMDDLAGDLGMSRSKFYRKFSEITDRPPAELINMIRLKRASNLLLYDRKSISEAAYESGFSSPSYFTKTFIRYYKQRPSDYLKNNSSSAAVS